MITNFDKLFNLHNGEDDKVKTLENVKKNISFNGANLWILACAIIIASVGLNVNSTAVIIGAMLISPLMGPILASGFALATFDFELLKKSLRNLLVATVVSVAVSAIYFFISPFKEVQSELLARTSPNIYDILIAFFGGLVGVIAITRVEKGNPIPGVAIATALMPPLCTVGYGLATLNFRFFFGALFLYSINCVFICIATFLIVKFLKYPAKTLVNKKYQKQIKYGITIIVTAMLIPSGYFAFRLYNQQKYNQTVNKFVETELTQKGNTLIFKKINYNAQPKLIELAFLSRQFDSAEIKSLNSKLSVYGITNSKLEIKQGADLMALKSDILNEVNKSEKTLSEKDKIIEQLQKTIEVNNFDNSQILKECKSIFPSIVALSLANHNITFPNDSIQPTTVLLYKASKELNKEDRAKLQKWLTSRLELKLLEIYREQ